MSRFQSAVDALHVGAPALAEQWEVRMADDEPITFATNQAETVVAVPPYALEACGRQARPTPARPELVNALFRVDPPLALTVDQVSRLREIVQPVVAEALDPTDTVDGVTCLHSVVDTLMARTAGRLAKDALVDPLTGVGNRRAMERDLGRELANVVRHDHTLTLLMIDLDGLKRLNDGQGHAVGDQALQDLATAFAGTLRAGDRIYRIGGDEFVALLSETTREGIQPLVARAASTAPAFSMGSATAPDDGTSAAALLDAADQGLSGGRRARPRAGAALVPVKERSLSLAALGAAAAILVPIAVALVLADLARQLLPLDLGTAAVTTWRTLAVMCGIVLAFVLWRQSESAA